MVGSPCVGRGFIDPSLLDRNLLRVNRALWYSSVRRSTTRDVVSTMNRAVRGRRLASPVRIALAMELGTSLDGAWWPHTASVAEELPELVDTLSARLGEIIAISINWSSWEGSPDFDALNRPGIPDPSSGTAHHRLMMVTGSAASASLLVVPCRTSNALAVMVLRQAATLPITPLERDTKEFLTGETIVRTARAESALCARRLRNARLALTDAEDPVVTG
ncbi:MAG: hypothetical protein QOH91_2263 [Mycobacterium sp.]|nr:hypothetical protein [Mycobacterium sp.]